MRISVIGGGISGLTTAHLLKHNARASGRALDVQVYEAATVAGGYVRSARDAGFLFELGPNGFLSNAPETLALVEQLGLSSRLLRANAEANRRYLFRKGKLHALPDGPASFLKTNVLSLKGRLRVMTEATRGDTGSANESIHEFVARRFGAEAADVLADAMVSGVFAGDAKRLHLRSCFPRVAKLEAEHGSLLVALKQAQKTGDAAPTLRSFPEGMGELASALARELGSALQCGQPVRGLRRDKDGWTLHLEGGPQPSDVVILATPPSTSAALCRPFDPALADQLAAIPSAPIAVVALGFRRADVGHPLDGYGLLAPRGEGLRQLGSLWSSSLFASRAPDGQVLLRSMIGGAHDPGALDLTDEALLAIVQAELTKILDLGSTPTWTRVARHPGGIPQYDVDHPARLAAIDTRLAQTPGLHLAGNGYRGISINACIENAASLAASLCP